MERIAREFKKPFFSGFDWRFVILLCFIAIIEAFVVYMMASRPIKEDSEQEIERIQQRWAEVVLGKEPVSGDQLYPGLAGGTQPGETGGSEDSDGGEESGEGSAEGEGGGDGEAGVESGPVADQAAERRTATRMEAAETRRRAREAISGEVRNKGLLGLLTGTGSAAEGDAVSGVLTGAAGSGAAMEDLDQVLSSVDGLKSGGGSGGSGGGGGGVRGGRSGKEATIDDLVSDLETANTSGVQRKGSLKVEAPSEVAGTARKSIARSPNAIHEVLLGHIAAIRSCYERELKKNPELKGKITVRITVAPDGSVKKVEVISSTIQNSTVEGCIVRRIERWRDFQPIDPSEGDVTFRQVYTFGY